MEQRNSPTPPLLGLLSSFESRGRDGPADFFFPISRATRGHLTGSRKEFT